MDKKLLVIPIIIVVVIAGGRYYTHITRLDYRINELVELGFPITEFSWTNWQEGYPDIEYRKYNWGTEISYGIQGRGVISWVLHKMYGQGDAFTVFFDKWEGVIFIYVPTEYVGDTVNPAYIAYYQE